VFAIARARRGLIGAAEPRGQALVVMVGVMLLSLALLAVIVDGGNVLSQQRIVQTGSDASAEAGAIVLAERLAGASTPGSGWDATVEQKVQQSAAANGLTIQAAYYTDICGIPLQSDGSAALNGDGTENLGMAVEVGSGALPGGSATTPDCPSRTVGPVAGVMVLGQKDVATFVARAINVQSIAVTTRATAVAGYLQGFCDASEGEWCAVLPVTIPAFVPFCDNNGDLDPDSNDDWVTGVVYTIGLCGNDPGNIGWLDWDPPGGGASELTCEIVNPDNPAILLPSWRYVVQTGNVNGGGPCADDDTGVVYNGVEAAIRKYNGQIVLIPQFSPPNCNPGPNESPNMPQVTVPPNYGCSPPDQGGSGQNQWYRITSFAFLQLCDPSMPECDGLQGAYLEGNNQAVCDQGNGQTGCLVGKLVHILSTGTVGPGSGSGTGTKALGVQLIK
jgi:hypothetical protein